jgi:hypothetical protein
MPRTRAHKSVLALLLLPLSACTGVHEDPYRSSGHAAVEWKDNGTALAALVAVDPVSCGAAGAEMGLTGEVTSTASASFVELVVEIDGVETGRHTLVEAGAFAKRDDLKVAPIESRIPMPTGQHQARLCLGQRGAKGRPEKGACIPAFDYDVDCQPVDTTEPSIVPEVDAAPNENGWYRGPVTVSFTCADAESGVSFCSEPVTLATDGLDLSAVGHAQDRAGNKAAILKRPIRIDQLPPTVTFPGAREYLVDEVVDVACVVGDGLSGVKESTCRGASGEAYLLGAGVHAVSGQATDLAGNSVEARGEFSVSVTSDSVCRLVERFALKSNIVNSLCVKLRNAHDSISRGNAKAATGQLDAFQNELSAQSGKAFSYANAATLMSLADELRP